MEPKDSDKSPISLVHEMAHKLKLECVFEINDCTRRNYFITECKVGDIKVEGQGISKKKSKIDSAEKMLVKLKKLPPSIETNVTVRKLKKGSPIYTFNGNVKDSVAELRKLFKNQPENIPVYTVIGQAGPLRMWVVTAGAQGFLATGYGTTKKYAKRAAANLLLLILTSSPPPPPEESGSGLPFYQAPPTFAEEEGVLADVLRVGESFAVFKTTISGPLYEQGDDEECG